MLEGATQPALAAEPEEPVAPLRPRRLVPVAAVGVPVALGVLLFPEPSAWSAVAAAGAFLLVWLAAIDLEARLVPNRLVVPATAAVLAVAVALDPLRGGKHALAALLAGAAFLVAVLVRPDGLGMGDVKLAALLGALLGADVLTAFLLGFLLVAVVAVALLVRRGRTALATQLPLVPFLACGAVVVLLLA